MNLMHSCRQVAQLLTLAYDERLGWWDRVRLQMHLSMCNDCSRVATQLDALDSMTGKVLAAGVDTDADRT